MTPKDPQFITKGFYGTVVLKDWMAYIDGQSYMGFTGRVSIIKDTELVGFEAHGNESNWVARIEGPTQSVTILGCQIRGAIAHASSASDPARNLLTVP